MSLGKLEDLLMYAPFVGVYEVPEEVKRELTEEKFFDKNGCYVSPEFDARIKAIYESVIDDMKSDDIPIRESEIVNSLNAGKKSQQMLDTWLENNGDGIFIILGDAGTGKSTFIHHMRWEKQKYNWRIMDIKKAIRQIKIGSQTISFNKEDFVSLHGKALSIMLIEIRNLLFPRNSDGEYDYIQTKEKMNLLLDRYRERIISKMPLERYAILYEKMRELSCRRYDGEEGIEFFNQYVMIFSDYFRKNCVGLERNRDNETSALECVLTHLLIILRCFDEMDQKSIIVFDNIERFIGKDEIYNKELNDFSDDLRHFSDNLSDEFRIEKYNINRFAKKYQFVLSMRNTTIRNRIPAESSDFPRHSIDLSNWFDIGEVISRKLEWYASKGIEIMTDNQVRHIKLILSDMRPTNNYRIRGLRPKLDMIFNYNKRLITTFLVRLFDSSTPKYFKDAANRFSIQNYEEYSVMNCLHFAYRSVVWRRVLDWIREGNLFKMEVLGRYETEEGRIADINYIWKMLVVLSNYSMTQNLRADKTSENRSYMPFLDMIKAVYQGDGNFQSFFYEDGFALERERLARILFYMNYYDRKDNCWVQFVDIQYNVHAANRKQLEKWEDLLSLFMDARQDTAKLKVRVTTAGKAYLNHIAPTFEFISCMAGKRPLLCCLPTKDALCKTEIEHLPCIEIIDSVLHLAERYLFDFKPHLENKNLEYFQFAGTDGLSYTSSLANSVHGYLANFCDCIDRLIESENESVSKKKRNLIDIVLSKSEDFSHMCRTYQSGK